MFTHEQLEWQWHLWACPDSNHVRPSGGALSKHLSLEVSNCDTSPHFKCPNLPTINTLDWLNCRRTGWIVHASQCETTDYFRVLYWLDGVDRLDRWAAPCAPESKLSSIDLFSSPHISLCTVYPVEVSDVDSGRCFSSSSTNVFLSQICQSVLPELIDSCIQHSFENPFWLWGWRDLELPPSALHLHSLGKKRREVKLI